MNVKNLILLFIVAIVAIGSSAFTSQQDTSVEVVFTREGFSLDTKGWVTSIYSIDPNYPGSEVFITEGLNPSFSKDGNLLVYQKTVMRDAYYETNGELVDLGFDDIFIMDMKTRTSKNITNTPHAEETRPKISPDGALVAYEKSTLVDNYWDVCFFNTEDGTNWCLNDVSVFFDLNCNLPKEEKGRDCIYDPDAFHSYVDLHVVDHFWVPNLQNPSQKVLILYSHSYASKDPQGEEEVFALTLKDNLIQSLKKIANGKDPAISPDGTKLFYVSGNKILVTDIEGARHDEIITFSESHLYSEPRIIVSPDSRKIVYELDTHIYTANIDGSDEKAILWLPGKYLGGFLSSDKIIYSSLYYYTDEYMGSLYTYDLKNAKTTKIDTAPDDSIFDGGDYFDLVMP